MTKVRVIGNEEAEDSIKSGINRH